MNVSHRLATDGDTRRFSRRRGEMFPLVTAVLVALAASAAGAAGGHVHPVNCLCRPRPSTPQTAFCSHGGLSRVPRCVASDVADLHLAYPLVHSVLPDVFVGNEFYKLQVVLLDHNRVRFLLGDEFRETPSLSTVDLSHNILEGPLPVDLFTKNSVMRHLDLSHNLGLGIVPDNTTSAALVTSATLRSLDLSHCGLVDLSTDTPALQRLTASWNSIGELLPETFTSMPQLVAIDLSHNVLRSLANGTFKDLTKLSDLNLSYNLLEGQLPGDLLTSCTEVRHLDLSHNTRWGASIEDDELPLVSSSSLLSVAVTHCGLVRLSLDTPAIQRLNASFNSISEVHEVTFRAMRNLSVLDLSYNKLKTFSLSLPSIRVLNLSNNAIENLDQDTFGEMPQLSVLDLSSNKITAISSIILPEIYFLNMSGNALTFFTDSVISENASKMILDLSYNKLTEVAVSLDYEELLLGENPFICSCKMLKEIGKWLRRTADNKSRRCWKPKALRGLLWTHFLTNQYCMYLERHIPETATSSSEYTNSSTVNVTTAADTTPSSLTSEVVHQEEMKASEEEVEEGMSAYNATMVALVVWGLVAYPCVVALRRASRSLCHYVKRHRSSVAPCVARCDEDGGGGGGGGGGSGSGPSPRPAQPSGRRTPLPSPPSRPTSLALPPQAPPTLRRPPPPTPQRPTPPSGYDVLQFEAPRFRTPLPHYQQVVTPTPTPTPTSEDCSETQPLCFELSERAPPNVYVQDPVQPRIPERTDEPVYAEIYDVVRR
ncbi:insulin-like growth factor-binding protein complex acid labile subunit [Schistocerca piceifrons]|uniref:insulin-like growth factor-binding protein complex acid labile subunit n=1 Tax=Schistocerca piceifrons TaxID=274613 RepID=UPI001F5F20DC|nr:insulin-like growth factor-binding protein complex acid labile subunit [Schistocerca piceifrons]